MSTPVAIELTARLDKYLSQIGGVKDLTAKEVKALQAQLSRDIKGAEQAARALAEQQKKLAQGNKDFVTSAGDAGQGAKKLRGLVGQLGGEYAATLGLVDDVGDAIEVFGETAGVSAVSAGLLGAAIAALAVTYQAITGDIARVAETSASLQRAHDSLIPSERELRDVQLDLAEALGLTTRAMADQERARNKARDSVLDFGKAQDEERQKLRETTASAQAWLSVIDKDSIVGGMVDAVAGWSMTIEQNQIRTDGLNRALVEQHDLQKQIKDSTGDVALARDADTAAIGRETAALQAQIPVEEQVRQLREKVAAEQAAHRAEVYAAESADALEGQARMARVEEEQAASAKRAADAQIEEIQRVADEEQRIYETRLSATADLFGAMQSAFGSLSQNLTDEQKDAQMALFVAQQLAAAAQAAVNTELAVSQAAASAPPPYNAIPIAAAYATGVATELAIATTPPPSFTDTPQVMRNQGAGPITVAGGDYVAAARNPEDLRRQVNAATDPMADYRDGGGTYAIVGARAYGRRITDDVHQRTPLSTILAGRRDRPLGRRG